VGFFYFRPRSALESQGLSEERQVLEGRANAPGLRLVIVKLRLSAAIAIDLTSKLISLLADGVLVAGEVVLL